MNTLNKEELDKLEATQVYKLVLSGKLNQFPKGYWQQPKAKENSIKCVRWLFEDYLNMSIKDIKECDNINSIIKKHALSGIINSKCFSSINEVIILAFPGQIKPWEFRKTSQGFWKDQENVKAAADWLIDKKLK